MIPYEKLSMPHDGSFPLYVAGFLFRDCYNQVCLIQKQHPTWQKGKWNGIGGHVDKGETPHNAMIREFLEETGTTIETWRAFLYLQSDPASADKWGVMFYTAHQDGLFQRTMTDEIVEWHRVADILVMSSIIPNLRWIVRMAMDPTVGEALVTERCK